MAQFARLKELIQLLPESERDEGLGLLAEIREKQKAVGKEKIALTKENKKLNAKKYSLGMAKVTLTKENKKLLANMATKVMQIPLTKENKKLLAEKYALGMSKVALTKENKRLKERIEENNFHYFTLEAKLAEARKFHEDERSLRIKVEGELRKEKRNHTEIGCLSIIGKGIDSKVIDTVEAGFRYEYKKTKVEDVGCAVPLVSEASAPPPSRVVPAVYVQ